MKKGSIYYIYAFVIIMVLLATLFLDSSIGSRIITVVTVCSALLGAVSIFIQYKRDKDVNQANFILEYGKYFYSLTKVEETMQLLDDYRSGNRDIVKKIDYTGIVNYLFWCEELSTLVQKGVIDVETIDNIFSYNFFLITNNEYIQKKELVPSAEFYKGIYYLHYVWIKYKKDTKQPILNEEESLNKVENYASFAKKGDLSNKSIF